MGFQRSTLFSIAIAGLLTLSNTACNKDKYTTKPQLKFVKAENYTVPIGGLVKFTLNVTDKEGDLTDSIYIKSTTTSCPQSNRTLGYLLPEFPTSTNANVDLEITFVNGQFIPGYVALPGPACGRPDTTTFKFWIKDKEKNVSDTVQTDKPLIILN